MKKTLSVILTLLMLHTTALAQVEETPKSDAEATEAIVTDEPVVYDLGLEEAIEMAYTNNPQLETNLYVQNGNKINYETAKYIKKQYKNIAVNVTSNFELQCIKKGYYESAAKVQYDLSVMEYDKIRHKIAYDVTEAYYNCALIQKLVNAAQNSYNLALANFNTVDAQYKLGLIAKMDYENASIAVTQASNALESYKLNQEIAHESLKILLNKDKENCTIVVSDEVDCTDYTSDTEADIAAALESRYDLTALKMNAQLANEYFEYARVLTSTSATYNTAYASYVKADYDYNNTQKLITLSLRNAYNSILTAKSNMNTAQLSYEMKVKEYESASLKYQLGMITNLELTKSINDLYEAQTAFANAKVTYKLAVEKYKYEITIGL